MDFYGAIAMAGNLQALERPLLVIVVVPSLEPVVHRPLKRNSWRGCWDGPVY